MLNTAPDTVFSSLTARQAAAHAIDRERLNAVRGLDIPTIAAGPFGPGSMGFLEDSGYPEYDLEKAKELVAQYEQESGNDFRSEEHTSELKSLMRSSYAVFCLKKKKHINTR